MGFIAGIALPAEGQRVQRIQALDPATYKATVEVLSQLASSNGVDTHLPAVEEYTSRCVRKNPAMELITTVCLGAAMTRDLYSALWLEPMQVLFLLVTNLRVVFCGSSGSSTPLQCRLALHRPPPAPAAAQGSAN